MGLAMISKFENCENTKFEKSTDRFQEFEKSSKFVRAVFKSSKKVPKKFGSFSRV